MTPDRCLSCGATSEEQLQNLARAMVGAMMTDPLLRDIMGCMFSAMARDLCNEFLGSPKLRNLIEHECKVVARKLVEYTENGLRHRKPAPANGAQTRKDQ